jgi:hypothetical protein
VGDGAQRRRALGDSAHQVVVVGIEQRLGGGGGAVAEIVAGAVADPVLA